MGMFDRFEPVPTLHCPKCGEALRHWQGKPNGSNQFVWRQGTMAPVSHAVDEKWAWPRERLEQLKLPEPEFEIYMSCNCGQRMLADCRCVDSIWVETRFRKVESGD